MPYKDRERRREYNRKYQRLRPAKRSVERRRHRVASRKKLMLQMIHSLKSVPCYDCGGVFPPVAMDFDHRPGTVKKFNVAHSLVWPVSTVVTEIAKCDVVCANFHPLRTYMRTIRGCKASGEPSVCGTEEAGSTPAHPSKFKPHPSPQKEGIQ